VAIKLVNPIIPCLLFYYKVQVGS